MKRLTDKAQATALLEAQDSHGYSAASFIRANGKGYMVVGLCFSVFLVLLAYLHAWTIFGYLAFFIYGMLMREVNWYFGLSRRWRFLSKVIDWDAVKTIAKQDPSA